MTMTGLSEVLTSIRLVMALCLSDLVSSVAGVVAGSASARSADQDSCPKSGGTAQATPRLPAAGLPQDDEDAIAIDANVKPNRRPRAVSDASIWRRHSSRTAPPARSRS